MQPGFISEPCYNLFYLELAACRLTELPADFARLVPNVRMLNLNYNFLEDLRPLEGLSRLRKLTIIGSRIKSTKQFVRVLKGMLDIEILDFRYVITRSRTGTVRMVAGYVNGLPFCYLCMGHIDQAPQRCSRCSSSYRWAVTGLGLYGRAGRRRCRPLMRDPRLRASLLALTWL